MPREGIHPDYNPVVFVDGDYELITKSTLTSRETRVIDGVEHYVLPLEISSSSHPFWTGQQKFVDSEGRVQKFRAKYARARGAAATKKEEEAGETPAE